MAGVLVVGVLAIVVAVVLTSVGVETDLVAPLIVVGAFDSVEIVIDVEPAPVVEGMSEVVVMDIRVVVSEIVVTELCPSVEIETDRVVSPKVVREELSSVVVVKTVLEATGLVDDEVDSVWIVTEEELSVGVVEDTTVPVEVITVVLVSLGVVEDEVGVFV